MHKLCRFDDTSKFRDFELLMIIQQIVRFFCAKYEKKLSYWIDTQSTYHFTKKEVCFRVKYKKKIMQVNESRGKQNKYMDIRIYGMCLRFSLSHSVIITLFLCKSFICCCIARAKRFILKQ